MKSVEEEATISLKRKFEDMNSVDNGDAKQIVVDVTNNHPEYCNSRSETVMNPNLPDDDVDNKDTDKIVVDPDFFKLTFMDEVMNSDPLNNDVDNKGTDKMAIVVDPNNFEPRSEEVMNSDPPDDDDVDNKGTDKVVVVDNADPNNFKPRCVEVMNSDPPDDDVDNKGTDKMVVDLNNLKPRSYQVKVYEVAMKKNTIAVLETGSGKTLIAVMLINEIGLSMKLAGDKRLILFLAPTVHLVIQQSGVIKEHTDFQVGEYYGAKGVDDWNAQSWEKEINDHDVLVMTPQILLDALRKAFLSLDIVSLMVIDECHRATGNHPYSKLMKEFYHNSRIKPKIFGMTASPVTSKGVSSTMDCEHQLSELESILDSQIYTIEDRKELEAFVPTAKEINRFYNPALLSHSELKDKLESLWSKYDAMLAKLQGAVPSQYKDMEDKLKIQRKHLSNDHAKILYCVDDLGLVCAYEAAKICIEHTSNSIENCELYRESTLQCKTYLEEVMAEIGNCLPQSMMRGSEGPLDIGLDYGKTLKLGYLSPKVYELIEIFQSLGVCSEVLCLIFVDRIISAKVIETLMKRILCLSHFTFSYLTGSNSSVDGLAPSVQKQTLESFRSGKVNLLFTTDVVEEGIHVPNCSCVIRFDLPKTVRSYVQSRGRARQNDSHFVMMIERGNMKQRDQIFDIIRSERSMTDTSINRDRDACFLRPCTYYKTADKFVVEATGASVTADCSVALIHQYCGKLPGDMFFTPKPIFQLSKQEGSYQYKLTLPPNAPFQTIDGPDHKNSHVAKQLVCLEACKKLHSMGGLDDHLLPYIEIASENNVTIKQKGSHAGAGTTKLKELHGTVNINSLYGKWGDKVDKASFESYRVDFSCNIADGLYSGFVLLLESKLADDVGNTEMELFLHSNKLVKASIHSCGKVILNDKQIDKAKCFQELFFNGLFGKLFIGAKSSKEFLFNTDRSSLWDPSNMYLLLPLEPAHTSSKKSLNINWVGVNSCEDVVQFLKKNSRLSSKYSNGKISAPQRTDSVETKWKTTNTIHLANNSMDVESLKDMVVMAAHSGRIYCILEILMDTTAESPFDGNDDPSDTTTFANYFKKTYGIELLYPEQPLLLLKQSHNPHNLLTNFSEEEISHRKKKSGNKKVEEKPRFYVRMPPELLVGIDVPMNVLKSFYLLPSVMHRMESLMLASQLREEIACQSNEFHISSSLILEALTTLRCCESFSMERLELLGDSVLKYTVSCHLFLKFPEKHEGQLSARRSYEVCNATLHKLGTDRNIQGYIRDGAFDPRRWTAPGQLSVRPVPCCCGLGTSEVPLEKKFFTEDPKIIIGKSCDKGHRWMGSKTLSDCVEGLIGAYYVGGGLVAAVQLMKWFGIDCDLEPSHVVEAINTASLRSYAPKINEIQTLESKVGYEFLVKGLLLEAITHASEQESGAGFCYQRLEYLGDSVLDLLMTWHLYENHTDIDPGELTDLRTASVNNENFAQAAVRHNLHPHLQHCSGLLLTQITDYVNYRSGPEVTAGSLQGPKGPKVLGDLVESIAGAVLIDTKLNVDEVWRIFKPLLSPLITPDKLELPPLRELTELCDSLGYFVKDVCTKKGEVVHAELRLQLKDELLVREACGRNRKIAKGEAASLLLKDLEERGISSPRCTLSSSKLGSKQCNDTSAQPTDVNQKTNDENTSDEIRHKKQKTGKSELSAEPTAASPNHGIPVIGSINMKKGGPRTCLFDLCRKQQWPMPTFEYVEEKSRSPITFGEGPETRHGFSSFVSKISLHIPNQGVMDITGEARADKKSSSDSAALIMLYELQRQGKLVIGTPL